MRLTVLQGTVTVSPATLTGGVSISAGSNGSATLTLSGGIPLEAGVLLFGKRALVRSRLHLRRRLGSRLALAVPIVGADGKVIGVLGIGKMQTYDFNVHEIADLNAVAALLAPKM